MSWVCSARSSIGPVVGSDITIDTIAAPEMIWGKRLPMSAMNGFSDMRSGYLANAFQGGRPLALAVT